MLIEKKAGLFTLQPVVMEYVTAHLVQQVCQEIITQEIVLLASHALIKATAAYSIRKIQVRLILKPIADRLLVQFGSRNKLEDQLAQILARQRAIAPRAPGYLGGNVFNLLSLTKELNHFDFSDLSVWQADARNISLYQCNFTDADLAKSVFTEDFGDVLAVSLSPDGKQLAASATSGEIRLWYTSNGLQRLTLRGHTGWVRSIAFSPDGQTLVSSSSDHQIKLWNLLTGHLKTLQGHTNRVRTVTFSPDGQTLASGSDDQTIKLWDTLTGRVKRTLKGHTERVRSIAFRPDGQVLASASDDQIIKLWDIESQCLRDLNGHQDSVCTVAWSKDGRMLASGGADATVKLWDGVTGEVLRTFRGHDGEVTCVTFSPEHQLLASASHDKTIKLWNTSTGQMIRTLQGRTHRLDLVCRVCATLHQR